MILLESLRSKVDDSVFETSFVTLTDDRVILKIRRRTVDPFLIDRSNVDLILSKDEISSSSSNGILCQFFSYNRDFVSQVFIRNEFEFDSILNRLFEYATCHGIGDESTVPGDLSRILVDKYDGKIRLRSRLCRFVFPRKETAAVLQTETLCENCRRLFKVLKASRKEEEEEEEEEEDHDDEMKDVEFKLSCRYCSEKFQYPYDLKRHLERHKGKKKPYSCLDCGKTFARSDHVKVHMTVHTKEKKYLCNACGTAFTRHSHLIEHNKRTHIGKKEFPCSECSKTFFSSQQLTRHSRVHSGERPYVCHHCTKSFSRSHHLATHLTRIHELREKRKFKRCSSSSNIQLFTSDQYKYVVMTEREDDVETKSVIVNSDGEIVYQS